MARRSKEDAQQTRESILDAAVTVFHARGVARPSLTEIAELAGVTRGAVYGHFRNKADLFSALTDRVQLPSEAVFEIDSEAARRDPLGALKARWIYLFERATSDREWQMILEIILHRCELVAENAMRERLLRAHAEAIERMTELVRQAVRIGQLPTDLDIPVAVQLLHASLVGVLKDWMLRPDAFPLAQVGERYIDAALDMLRQAPGLRRPAGARRASAS